MAKKGVVGESNDAGRAARELIRAGDQLRLTGSKRAADRVADATRAYDKARGK